MCALVITTDTFPPFDNAKEDSNMHIVHEPAKHVFVAYEGANTEIGTLSYFLCGDGKLCAKSTEVLPAHRGKGVAKQLLEALVAFARTQKRTIVPDCSYVASAFESDPARYADVIA